jgi:peptidoglycan hydrolase-like protein with peptidoglycan-binding domain
MKRYFLTILSLCTFIIFISGCFPSNHHNVQSSVQQPEINTPPSAQDIRDAQKALNDAGYNAGKVDGIFGKKTTAALTKFQRDHNLSTTGRLDNPTKNALLHTAENKFTAPPAETASETSFLKNVGKFYQGLGKQFHEFGDRSNNGFIKEASHLGGRIHTGIGDGIVETPQEEGVTGMTENVIRNGTNALSPEDNKE